MSDSSPSPVAVGAAEGGTALSPADIERVLADFRGWLTSAMATEQDLTAPAPPPVDLATLVGQFVALRHEVNLQTRSSRTQLEQNVQTLEKLSAALAALERRGAESATSQQDSLRPLLTTLIELHDALTLARREVQRIQDALGPLFDSIDRHGADLATDAPLPRLHFPWWARVLGLHRQVPAWEKDVHDWHLHQREELEQNRTLARRVRQAVDSVLTGYAMSINRLERALQQQGLERLDVVGKPFDPDTMEVLEAVSDPAHTPGSVLDVVRAGYRWQGRLFRVAQVKVARAG